MARRSRYRIAIVVSTGLVLSSLAWYFSKQTLKVLSQQNLVLDLEDSDLDTFNDLGYDPCDARFEFAPPSRLQSLFELFFDSRGTRTIVYARAVSSKQIKKLGKLPIAQMRELHMENMVPADLDTLLQFQQLQTLEIRDCRQLKWEDMARLSQLKSLRELSVGKHSDYYRPSQGFVSQPILDESIGGINACKNLRSISLDNVRTSAIRSLKLAELQFLEKLDIIQLHVDTDDSLIRDSVPKNLTSLSLWNSGLLSSKHLVFLSQLSRLKELRIICCPNIDDSLFDNLPNGELRRLDISADGGTVPIEITERGIVKLSKYHDCLEWLNLYGTRVRQIPISFVGEFKCLHSIALGMHVTNSRELSTAFPGIKIHALNDSHIFQSKD